MKQYELIVDIYRSLARIESLIDTGAVRLRTESGQTAVTERKSFFSYMKIAALELRRSGNLRTSETYTAAMNSFRKFLKGRDIMVDEIDSSIISSYESWLKDRGVCPNSTSFYMRNLRAAYNKAAAGGLTPQRQPFRNVYTGVDRTHKRAIPLETVRALRDMDLSGNPAGEFARDMFMLSFYTRGMAFVDMAFLRKTDLAGSILTYRRHKTGQRLQIRWEDCMQSIVSRYGTGTSPFLLPLIKAPGTDERRQYLSAAGSVNRSLKSIGRRLGLDIPLTMYVARHSWASAARSRNIPLPVISEGMGHGSDRTTRIYLASLDNTVIDEANRTIIGSL